MGQEQPQTVRGKRPGPTKRGQKQETHPIYHGSAVWPIIASDFGDTWEKSVNNFLIREFLSLAASVVDISA